jgi:hypothetical protein
MQSRSQKPKRLMASPNPIGESGLDRRAGVQRSRHRERRDRGAGKLGRDILSNAGKAQHLDVEHLPFPAARTASRSAQL